MNSPWVQLMTVSLALLAPILGGAAEPWAQGLILIFTAVLIFSSPSRRSLGFAWNSVLFGLFLLVLTSFVPEQWFSATIWRSAFTNELNTALPATHSAQPWISLEVGILFLAGIIWFYHQAAEPPDHETRRSMARLFGNGIILLSGVCLFFHFSKTHPSFWPVSSHFGPFINRNQTGNLLALGGILVMACAYQDYRDGKIMWIPRIGGLAVILAGLIVNGSRGGPILFFLGAFLWLLLLAFSSHSKDRVGLWASMGFFAAGIFLIFGGKLVDRALPMIKSSDGISKEFRWAIYQDSISMIKDSPWLGTGLGNFQSVFPFYRDVSAKIASASQPIAIHPESDWFWLGTEMGILALLLFGIAVSLFIWRAFLSNQNTHRFCAVRLAAGICIIVFLIHGFLDVSGHRMGTAWPAIFIAGLALPHIRDRNYSSSIGLLFRVAALGIGIVGAIWLYCSLRHVPYPGQMGAAEIIQRCDNLNQTDRFKETVEWTNKGLQWAPLEWKLYYQRAVAKLLGGFPVEEARNDFQRARFLMPQLARLRYQEGNLWLSIDPSQTLTLWQEAIHLSQDLASSYFGDMVGKTKEIAIVRDGLHEIARQKIDLWLIFLESANPREFAVDLHQILDEKIPMSRAQKEKLFSIWAVLGNKADLAREVAKDEALLSTGWKWVAENHAAQKEFESACLVVRRFDPLPQLPKINSLRSINELRIDFLSSPENYRVGVILLKAQVDSKQPDDAFITLRMMTKFQDCPTYLHYWEADFWMQKKEWEKAWNAWLKYHQTKK